MYDITRYYFSHNGVYSCVIAVCRKERYIAITIQRQKFEFWLLVNNKLKWNISSKENGEIYRIEEKEGTMTYEEYWSQNTEETIHSDLKEYITENKDNNYFRIQLSKLLT